MVRINNYLSRVKPEVCQCQNCIINNTGLHVTSFNCLHVQNIERAIKCLGYGLQFTNVFKIKNKSTYTKNL